MREFVDEHFNVIILVALLVGGASLFLHTTHHQQDATVVNWIEHVCDQILAALLGMMVGRATNGTAKSSTNGAPGSSQNGTAAPQSKP